ncbi:uncharacterized protein LOC126379637 [Pectinophora gossypiella]|uniref:uncharacterized protein LOC126379637 n=1 Tax=Pectinophora gossypiella TaxID=13191 RepID=UPI00214E04FF|nr:uncharacterized protein LOC126379637 [Pectinophora gossypiella]
MYAGRDEGPVYYREIQKNAYLKRIPNENPNKLMPLGHKKPPLKPMWTVLCVHNGHTPFLEQYPEAEAASTLAHKPLWRACLSRARHVTCSVKPCAGAEYDFLVDTDHGPLRMLAPDWESMQDWVTTLRNKLHELKILGKGENVYCLPPAPAPPRAAARDPTSPLPPTPPVPPDRVPGIELNPPPTRAQPDPEPSSEPLNPEPLAPVASDIDISNWEPDSTPSTSTNQEKTEPKKSVAKICGQNICLDDSILKRNVESTDSDEEFFAEIDRLHDAVENIDLGDNRVDYKQRFVVNEEKGEIEPEDCQNDHSTNITVIQVSNKPPHTAIPVLGPETDVFNFDLPHPADDFINIVNTEVNVQTENGYGTVFNDSDYGHLSLTTTVNVGKDNDGIYERLCMASTSNGDNSPLPLRKLKATEKLRKSSLPNLEVTPDSTYEYVFPNNNKNITVTLNREVNSNVTASNNSDARSNSDRNTSVNSNGVRVANTNTSDRVRNISEESSGNTVSVNIHVNLTSSISVGNVDHNTRVLRANVERSHSQNAYDRSPRRDVIRRVQNNSPKRDGKNDKHEPPPAKPLWKRGLTELSLLSRLRGRREMQECQDRTVTSPAKVVHRSRQEARVDSTRRRSSSLSNGELAALPPAPGPLVPLLARAAGALRAELRRGAAVAAAVPRQRPPTLLAYDNQVWVSRWGAAGARCGGRAGDRLAAAGGAPPRDAAHARQLIKAAHTHLVDILFHRVPLAKVYVLNKRNLETIGIKLDGECNIVSVEAGSPAARACLPPPGRWALTEVNNRPLNLLKGGDEEMNRLSLHGTEVMLLLQPSALVKKIRASLKANKPLLSLR